jgi:protein-S-isoprenylcysteine O-methyltransferase Ste14
MERAGVATLIEALGGGSSPRLSTAVLIGIFEVTIIGLAIGQAWLERRLGLAPWVVLAAVWAVWTGWHSWLFPRRRIRYLQMGDDAYRRAFVADIYPWVSLGFSQMWRPLANGDTLERAFSGGWQFDAVRVVVGLALAMAAFLVIVFAIRTIGIANAAFLREFVEPESFVPVEQGIYARMMHPLFWSGIAYSCGLAIAVGTTAAYELAAVNLVYGVIYVPLENRRLRNVFGKRYESYRARTGGLMPLRRSR